MEEAKEETSGFGKSKPDGSEGRRNGFRSDRVVGGRSFTTRSKSKSCIDVASRQNHPPWVCKAFKELSVRKRKELIENTNRYRCLAAGHHSKECPNAKCTW